MLIVRDCAIADHRHNRVVVEEKGGQIQFLRQYRVQDLVPANDSVEDAQKVDYFLGQSAAVGLSEKNKGFCFGEGFVSGVIGAGEGYSANDV